MTLTAESKEFADASGACLSEIRATVEAFLESRRADGAEQRRFIYEALIEPPGRIVSGGRQAQAEEADKPDARIGFPEGQLEGCEESFPMTFREIPEGPVESWKLQVSVSASGGLEGGSSGFESATFTRADLDASDWAVEIGVALSPRRASGAQGEPCTPGQPLPPGLVCVPR